MFIHQIEEPLSYAVIDQKHVLLHQWSTHEQVALLELSLIPNFRSILLFKYHTHLEAILTLEITDHKTQRMLQMLCIYAVLGQLEGVTLDTISNTLEKHSNYHYITLHCPFYANHQ